MRSSVDRQGGANVDKVPYLRVAGTARYSTLSLGAPIEFSHESGDSQDRTFRRTALIVGTCLCVALVGGAILYMYSSGLAPTKIERVWQQTQTAGVNASTSPLDPSAVVTLARTRCFGTCPAYVVTINGSGKVEFHGQSFVCAENPPSAQIDPELVRGLIAGLNAVGYFALPNFESRDVTDFPNATVTVKIGAISHTVNHYQGDRSAPRILTLIEQRIDEMAGVDRWVGGC